MPPPNIFGRSKPPHGGHAGIAVYAPFAGLLAVVFWLGVLSNRVATLEREERDRKGRDKTDFEERDRLTRVETILDSLSDKVGRVERQVEGVHRQLANLATGKNNIARELLESD